MTHSENEFTRIWQGHELFESVPEDLLDHLLGEMDRVEFMADTEIIRQGENERNMILLSEGTVHVSVIRESGAEVVNKTVEAPAILGEMALVTREPRAATVRTVTSIKGLSIGPIDFLKLTTEHPEVSGFLTALVGTKLKEGAGIRSVGKYKILRQLGAGAAATVFEATHPELGTNVALKMLSHALVAHPGFSSHFAREGKTAAQLEHPNIVRIMDTERAYGTLFIVMERLYGEVLSEVMENGKAIPPRKVRIILMDCLRALSYTHKAGLVHRDIKPSNLFLTQDGIAKLLDFGIAAQMIETESRSDRVGTPYYMSPEQIRGQSLDGRADLYSAGIMAFQLLTGELPYRAGDLKTLLRKHLREPFPIGRVEDQGYPDDLVKFIRIATRKNRDHRYPGCSEALAELTSGRELPFVHTLMVGMIRLTHPKEDGDVIRMGLKGMRSMMSAYGIRFCESAREHGGIVDIHMTVVAHPFHRTRVEGSISALTTVLNKRAPRGTLEVVWSPAEEDERDVLALPSGISTQ